MSQDSRWLGKLSAFVAISGLSVVSLNHRRGLEDWLSHSFDRGEIMKEFGRTGAETKPLIISESDSDAPVRPTEPSRVSGASVSQEPSSKHEGDADSSVDGKKPSAQVSRSIDSSPSSDQRPSTPQTEEYLAAVKRLVPLRGKIDSFNSLREDSIPAEIVVAKDKLTEVEAILEGLGKQLKSDGWSTSYSEKLELAQRDVADLERSVEMVQAEDVKLSEAKDTDGALLLNDNARAIIRFKGARKLGAVLNAQQISQLAEAYSSVGKYPEACVELIRVIRSEPNNERHYSQLLRLYAKIVGPDNDESIDTKFRYTVGDVGNRLTLSKAAAAFFTNERPNEKLALTWNSIAAQEIMGGRSTGCLPSECFATLTLVAAHYSKDASLAGQEHAISLWEKAKELATTLDEKKQISQLLIGARQFESGLRVLAEILKQAPDGNASTWADFTMVGSMEKNRSTAAQLLNEILEAHPTCTEALAALEAVAPHDPRQLRRANYANWSLQLKEVREELKRFDPDGNNKLPAEIVIANSIMTGADRELEALSALVHKQGIDDEFGIALMEFKSSLARVESFKQRANDDDNAAVNFEKLYTRKELLTRAEAALADEANDDTLLAGIRCYKAARRISDLAAPEVYNLASLYCRLKSTEEAKVELHREIEAQTSTAASSLNNDELKGQYQVRMLLAELCQRDSDPKRKVLTTQLLSQAFAFAREAPEFEQLGDELLTIGEVADALRAWATSLMLNSDATNPVWGLYLEVGSSPKHRHTCVAQLRDIVKHRPDCRRALEALHTLDPNDPSRLLITEYQEELKKVASIRQVFAELSAVFGETEPLEVVSAKAKLSKLEPLLQTLDQSVKNGDLDTSFRKSLSGLKASIASIQQGQREAAKEADYVRKLAGETSLHDLNATGMQCLDSTRQDDWWQANRYFKAMRLTQDDPEYTNKVGVSYSLLHMHSEAKIEYLRAIRGNPNQLFFYQNVLRAQSALMPNKDSAEFAAAYMDATSVGDRFNACYAAGLLYEAESFEKAQYWFQKGAELLRQGHITQAPDSYRGDCLARIRFLPAGQGTPHRVLPVAPLRYEPSPIARILGPLLNW